MGSLDGWVWVRWLRSSSSGSGSGSGSGSSGSSGTRSGSTRVVVNGS